MVSSFLWFDDIEMISASHFLMELNWSDYEWFPAATLILPRYWIIPLLGWLSPITPFKRGPVMLFLIFCQYNVTMSDVHIKRGQSFK